MNRNRRREQGRNRRKFQNLQHLSLQITQSRKLRAFLGQRSGPALANDGKRSAIHNVPLHAASCRTGCDQDVTFLPCYSANRGLTGVAKRERQGPIFSLSMIRPSTYQLTPAENLIINIFAGKFSSGRSRGEVEVRRFISMVGIAVLLGAGLFAGACILNAPSAVADPARRVS
jgi:hypothetical protein